MPADLAVELGRSSLASSSSQLMLSLPSCEMGVKVFIRVYLGGLQVANREPVCTGLGPEPSMWGRMTVV